MKLYLARHGETDWNAQHKAQGGMDILLNATGIQQAEALRDQIKNIDFTTVYSSPLQRAARTAQIATDGKYEIIYDDHLRERLFGSFEGQSLRGLHHNLIGYTDNFDWRGIKFGNAELREYGF